MKSCESGELEILARYRTGDPIYFVHIPKTAGTTVREALKRRFPKRLVCPSTQMNAFLLEPAARTKHCRLFTGHFDFGWGLDRWLARPVLRLCVLREPREWALSMFSHFLENAEHPLHDRVMASGENVDRFFADPAVVGWIHELQMTWIAIQDLVWTPERIRRSRHRGGAMAPSIRAEISQELDRHVPLDHYRRALERLRTVEFPGVAERIDDTLELMSLELNWPFFQPAPRRNRSVHRLQVKHLSQATLCRIDELTRFDRLLHAETNRILDERLAQARERTGRARFAKPGFRAFFGSIFSTRAA